MERETDDAPPRPRGRWRRRSCLQYAITATAPPAMRTLGRDPNRIRQGDNGMSAGAHRSRWLGHHVAGPADPRE
jgi:hypothetical protein